MSVTQDWFPSVLVFALIEALSVKLREGSFPALHQSATHRCQGAVSPLAVPDVGLELAAPVPVIRSLGVRDGQPALVVVVAPLRKNIMR